MPCEHYKDALIEAAASCTDLADAANSNPHLLALRAHLESCASCRAALAQEQSLFAAIDTGLHTVANAQVPPSLLPRVRARLDEVAVAPRLGWLRSLTFASASVALVLLIFLIVRPHRTPPVDQARQIPVRPAPMTSTASPNPEKASPDGNQIASTRASNSPAARNSTILHSAASSNPEVLVPLDERESLARLVATLNERGDLANALVAKASEKKDEPVQVNPLQIADIEIKPLAGTETESPDRGGETR